MGDSFVIEIEENSLTILSPLIDEQHICYFTTLQTENVCGLVQEAMSRASGHCKAKAELIWPCCLIWETNV